MVKCMGPKIKACGTPLVTFNKVEWGGWISWWRENYNLTLIKNFEQSLDLVPCKSTFADCHVVNKMATCQSQKSVLNYVYDTGFPIIPLIHNISLNLLLMSYCKTSEMAKLASSYQHLCPNSCGYLCICNLKSDEGNLFDHFHRKSKQGHAEICDTIWFNESILYLGAHISQETASTPRWTEVTLKTN